MELISKADAVRVIWESVTRESATKKIDELPAIEERKEGAWIILEEPIEGRPKRWRVKCPFCRKRLRITDRKLWEFCPCCGARMKGE